LDIISWLESKIKNKTIWLIIRNKFKETKNDIKKIWDKNKISSKIFGY
jgi:hypothetical protein